MRRVLLCMLEVLEVPEMSEVMRCVLLWMLGGVEGGLCLLEVSESREVLEAMRHVLLCMLEAVEGELCLLEGLEVMSCVLLCILGGCKWCALLTGGV